MFLFGLQVLAGCAGLTASITSRKPIGGDIDRAASFYIPVPEGASTDDRKIVQALIEEFRVGGLKVVSESGKAAAGYLVAVDFAEKSSTTAGSLPVSQLEFSTIRNSHGQAVGFVQTGSVAEIPYSEDYRVRTIDVSLFAVSSTGASDQEQLVWEGQIRAGARALSSHSRCIIRELVSRLGIAYQAETRIDIACRSR